MTNDTTDENEIPWSVLRRRRDQLHELQLQGVELYAAAIITRMLDLHQVCLLACRDYPAGANGRIETVQKTTFWMQVLKDMAWGVATDPTWEHAEEFDLPIQVEHDWTRDCITAFADAYEAAADYELEHQRPKKLEELGAQADPSIFGVDRTPDPHRLAGMKLEPLKLTGHSSTIRLEPDPSMSRIGGDPLRTLEDRAQTYRDGHGGKDPAELRVHPDDLERLSCCR